VQGKNQKKTSRGFFRVRRAQEKNQEKNDPRSPILRGRSQDLELGSSRLPVLKAQVRSESGAGFHRRPRSEPASKGCKIRGSRPVELLHSPIRTSKGDPERKVVCVGLSTKKCVNGKSAIPTNRSLPHPTHSARPSALTTSPSTWPPVTN
jgi:hypothetical protein